MKFTTEKAIFGPCTDLQRRYGGDVCLRGLCTDAAVDATRANHRVATRDHLAPTQVTGSRIPSPNLTSTSPVTQVTATDIRIEGVNNVENLLNNLPQVFADQGGNISNGSTRHGDGQSA